MPAFVLTSVGEALEVAVAAVLVAALLGLFVAVPFFVKLFIEDPRAEPD